MRPNPSSQESEAAIQVPSQPGQANSETLSPNKTRQSKNAEKQKAIPGSLRDGEREKTAGINTRYGKRGHLKGKWYLIIMVTNAHIVSPVPSSPKAFNSHSHSGMWAQQGTETGRY